MAVSIASKHQKKDPRKAGLSFVWHSLGDSNPCYRRERAAS